MPRGLKTTPPAQSIVKAAVFSKRPGFTDMIGRAKFDAWAAVKGTSSNDAMQKYVDLVKSLLAKE
ncbi:MAG: acyl-CoA-binding protein [Rhodocyclaceae bacterium]|nr:acyl-CoA-binding protein [Rhodocyclaceae bacterium]